MDYYEVAYDSGELTEAQTSLTISSLAGNTDEVYFLICRLINNNATATSAGLRLNGDTGSNYGMQYMYVTSNVVGAARSTADTSWGLSLVAFNQNNICFATAEILAKSGYERTAIIKGLDNTTGVTVDTIQARGNSWNNTADEITSLTILATQTSGLGVGSRVILLKKVVSGTSCWEQIYNSVLTEATNSITVSSLNGNTDVIYRIRMRTIAGGTVAHESYMRANNDSDAANYGFQLLSASGITVAGQRAVGTYPGFRTLQTTGSDGKVSMLDFLLYVKSGYGRTAFFTTAYQITGTTVGTIRPIGSIWSNSADNITSLVFVTGDADAKYGVGTYIQIDKLVL